MTINVMLQNSRVSVYNTTGKKVPQASHGYLACGTFQPKSNNSDKTL